MRMIAGLFKGKTLRGPEKGNRKIRPTSDRLREALFNIMIHRGFDFAGSSGMDLYAGTGALGLEALSRGAKKVLWVDQDEAAIAIVRDNAKNLQVHNCQDLMKPVLDVLHGSEMDSFIPLRWIFLDPPYDSDETEAVLKKIAERSATGDLLESGAWIVLETSSRDKRDYQQALGADFECVFSRDYGDTKLICWEW